MAKIRVHELAKEFGMTSKEMEARIKDMGFSIKNYMSTLEDFEVQEISRRLKAEAGEEEKKAPPARKVVRRRHKVVRVKKVVRIKKSDAGESGQAPAEKPSRPEKEQAESIEETAQKPSAISLSESAPEDKAPVAESAEDAECSASPEAEVAERVEQRQGDTDDHGPAKQEPVSSEAGKVEAGSEPQQQEDILESGSPAESLSATEGAGEEPGQGSEESVEKAGGAVASRPEGTVTEPETAGTDSISSSAREVSEGSEKQKKKKKEEKQKAPKQFVKIVDRVRIDLSRTAKPARQARPPRPERGKKSAAPAGGAPATGPAPDASPGMSRGGKRKKGKRVVQGSELGSGKRQKNLKKRWGKHKSIDRILADEDGVIKGRKGGKAKQQARPAGTAPIKAEKRKFAIYETIQPVEMAKKMGVKVGDIIMKLMQLGVMVTANQSIDYETAALVADEFGYEIEKKAVAEDLVHQEDERDGGEAVPRPPVITVMGHVDHGKTSLLDAIRRADVAKREAGGITQHIGAYKVKLASGDEVVFLDTPGHEAFTSMRARGASITDIVVLVVAADDGVMAQTREAIDHSRASGVPIIVAVNKIDKAGADPERVKRELAEIGLVPEDWGGDTIFVNVSAKLGTGIEELLDMMVLQAEVLELKADPNRRARGHVIESRLDRGRGPVATLLVEEGTLRVGEAMVAGLYHGKVRAMINDRGEKVGEAGPSTPVEVQGLAGVPDPGSEFIILENERKAREVAEYRQRKAREAELVKGSAVSLETMFQKIEQDKLKVFNIVLKADVQGSLEALTDSLRKLATDKIRLEVVRGGIGAITESDVLLAAASKAVILGFNVKPVSKAKALAEHEGVEIRFYDVIYHALEDIKAAMVGMLEPVYREVELGRAEVRETFHISKVGTIAGCKVVEGVIRRNAEARLLRDNVVIYKGRIASLKRFKDDVREVQAGYECGMSFDKFNDIKVGDVIEAFEMEEVAPELGESVADKEESSQNGQAE